MVYAQTQCYLSEIADESRVQASLTHLTVVSTLKPNDDTKQMNGS